MEITNVCNLKCSFCYKSVTKEAFMKIESIRKILPEIKMVSDYLYLHVKGEPLLHPNLKEILDLALANDLKIMLTTNATFLLEKEYLLKHQALIQINISLQSLSFQKDQKSYLKNILMFLEKETEKIINLRIWTKTVSEDLKAFLEANFQFDANSFYGKKHLKNNIFISREEEFIWPSLTNDIISNSNTCLGTISQIGILVDGRVVACCLDFEGITTFGNCLEEKLSEIILKREFLEFQKNLKEHKKIQPLCLRCNFYKRRK